MPLGPGNSLGSYDVHELLGEGGMGAVYRAHDRRLRRDVALKVILPAFVADPDRLARFEREARMLAALTHPNIATIHGLEDVDGVRVLVMELVPGITLAARVVAGPIPIHEALQIAVQIAAAIEAAHERGIIHRDLKPSNIKLTSDGTVKLLDFGLAKALAPQGSGDDALTLTLGGTAEGSILGTVAYMSPEQARGQSVDTRTDIWAFGCVLYDMFTGRPAFDGATLSDTIAAILTRNPDWSRMPADVPAAVAHLVRRCLVKDARRRLRDIGDARLELEEALGPADKHGVAVDQASSWAEATRGPSAPARPARRVAWPPLVAVFLAGLVTGAAAFRMWTSGPGTLAPTTAQFSVPLPAGERLEGLDFPSVVLSPTDSHLAYVATKGGSQQLFVRDLSGDTAVALASTDGALSPFFSPDGAWIAFFAGGKLKKVPVSGGPGMELADASIGFGGSWGPDNTIVFAPNNGSALWQVPSDGGTARVLTTLDAARGEFSHRWPEILPDGRSVLFSVGTKGSWDDAEIVVQTIKSGERHTLIQGGTDPHVLPDGRLLYARGGSLMAVPFDADRRRLTGQPSMVLEGVAESLDGAAQVSVSRAGSLVYVPRGTDAGTRTLVWVDRRGEVQPLAAPPRAYAGPRLSPDGRTVAVTIGTGDRDELWTYDVARNALAQVTFNGGFAATWSTNGGRLVFSSNRDGLAALFARRVEAPAPDGGGTAPGNDQRLARGVRAQVPGSISPDGTVALVEYDASGRDIALLRDGDTAARPFLASGANETAPAFSPDGRLLAFVSDESGRNEVYVAPTANAARPVQVSTDGGAEPVWRRDGEELFFRAGTKMMVARVRTRPILSAAAPTALFDGTFETDVTGRAGYDVNADGARFLMVTAGQEDRTARELRVILGWTRPSAQIGRR